MKKNSHSPKAINWRNFTHSFAFIFLVILSACDNNEDDSATPLIAVQFSESAKSLSENSGENIVTLGLSKPALAQGYVEISIASEHPERFNTFPTVVGGVITLPVAKGQTSISFTFVAINNQLMDGNATVEFKLTGTSTSLSIGSLKSTIVTLMDDETTVKANFILNAGSIRENKADGLDVILVFNGFAKTAGTITIKLESSNGVYGTDFITEPAAVNGQILLEVPKDIEYASFEMLPVNNSNTTGDRVIRYTIQDATGGIGIGNEKKLDITILDDETYPVATVADIRKMYDGEQLILPNTLITAVITSIKDNTDGHYIFIEDQTGGIAVRLIFNNDFQRGDLILFNMGYGLLKNANGVLEIQQVSEADKVGTSALVYDLMTLEELYNDTDENESTLVMIHGVSFPDANNVNVMRGDHAITDGTRSIIVRTLPQASFANKVIPAGDYVVRGILTEADGTFILYPQVFADDIAPNATYDWP